MRFELFQIAVSRAGRRVTGFVVAPSADRAEEIVAAQADELDRDGRVLSIERVDDTLPPLRRKGLDALLETAPPGFASFNAAVGWVAHAVPALRLQLFRIDEPTGDVHHVVAPSSDVAAALWWTSIHRSARDSRLFRIADGAADLAGGEKLGLEVLLEFGPAGLAEFGENGWQPKD